MKSAWAIGIAVTLAGHSALGVGIATYDGAPPPAPKKTVVRFQAWRPPEPPPPPPKEPPPPPPPLVKPPPRVVKRDRPRPPQPVDRPVATQTHIEPAPSGITDDASATQGTLVTQGGDGVTGPVQDGHGVDKVAAPPAPPPAPPAPRRVFVPLLEVTRIPRAIDPVQPEVPETWKASGREAVVVVEVAISAHGKVLEARALKRAGSGLDEAAVAAALKTRFEPALVGDKPVAVRMQIPYRFKVRG